MARKQIMLMLLAMFTSSTAAFLLGISCERDRQLEVMDVEDECVEIIAELRQYNGGM